MDLETLAAQIVRIRKQIADLDADLAHLEASLPSVRGVTSNHPCATCGNPVVVGAGARSRNARYCSDACKSRAYRERKTVQ